MTENKFDYYYGAEGDQFSFIRIPKLMLFDPKFKDLSLGAKMLYGLLLDRMNNSIKHGWIDENNHVYITKPAGTDYSTEEENVSNSDELGAMLDNDSEEKEEELEVEEGLEKPKVYVRKDDSNNFGFTNNAFYLFLALLVVLLIIVIIIFVI